MAGQWLPIRCGRNLKCRCTPAHSPAQQQNRFRSSAISIMPPYLYCRSLHAQCRTPPACTFCTQLHTMVF